jgi:ABC-type lipoprotein export system ATPase subunit
MGFPCPNGFNIADWLLDVTTPTTGGAAGKDTPLGGERMRGTTTADTSASDRAATRGNSGGKILEMAEYYKDSSHNDTLNLTLSRTDNGNMKTIGDVLSESSASASKYSYLRHPYASSFWTQFSVLFVRNVLNMRREWTTPLLQLVLANITAILVGTLYSETGNGCTDIDSLDQIPVFLRPLIEDALGDECITEQLNQNAAIFVGPTLLMVTSFQMVNFYIDFMKIFLRERASGQYMCLPFLLARLAVEIPFLCVQGASYGTVLYWLAGFRPDFGAYVFYAFTMAMTINLSGSFCNFFGCLCSDLAMAINAGNGVYGIGLLFGGFYISYDNMPAYYSPFYFTSVFKWPCSALLLNQFEGPGGEFVLDFNGLPSFEQETKWFDLMVTILMVTFFHLCSYVTLVVKSSTGKVAPKAAAHIDNLITPASRLQKEELSAGSDGSGAPVSVSFTRKSSYTDSILPVRLRWSDVYYSVDTTGSSSMDTTKGMELKTATSRPSGSLPPPRHKAILSSVHGVVESGQVLAVMGPSDAGKSTLLDILAARKNTSSAVLTGSVLYNGQTAAELGPIFSRLVGYVVQDSYLLHTLTVRETLLYTAKLRLPDAMALVRRGEIVDDVIEQLGLTKVQHSKVGDESNRGVSGGEYRRLSIGIELVTSPSILILDEPTSGLSAADAFTCLRVLKVKMGSTGGEACEKKRKIISSNSFFY